MTVDSPRTIVLLRHAKADWPPARTTSDRWPTAAATTPRPPAAVSSTTASPSTSPCVPPHPHRETWKLAAHELEQRPKTVYEERLYDASLGQLIALVNETRKRSARCCWSATTPACTAWPTRWRALPRATRGTGMSRTAFPTAAFAVLTFAGSWKSVEPGVGRLVNFWAPHKA